MKGSGKAIVCEKFGAMVVAAGLYYHVFFNWLKSHFSFRRLHVFYFIFFAFIGFLSLYASPTTSHQPCITAIDALFNAVSALTVTGLSTVEMHRFSSQHMVSLLFLMVLGSQVFTSAIPLLIRLLLAPTTSPVPVKPCSLEELRPKFEADLRIAGIRRAISMPALKSKAWLSISSWLLEEARIEEEGEREAIEREALAMLSKLVPIYFVVVQAVGFLVCEIYVISSHYASRVLKENGINRSFFCIFSVVSSFANAGFILLDENLVPLQRASTLLVFLSILILLGNTMFAPTLRFIIWILYHTIPSKKKVYRYLLKCPRRCYTHLFPQHETLWLVSTVAIFNVTQIISICAFDWYGPAFEGLITRYKLVDSFFQSITTRNAGMNVINLAALASSTLFFCIGMMYIAAYPVYMTRQRSKEPTIVARDGSISNPEKEMHKQVRSLLSRDSVYVFLATFFICISERESMLHDPTNFSVFSILFEVVSGYANVGLSLGYSCTLRPTSLKDNCVDVSYSFSGKWSVMGKFLLIIVMMLGRHRGLPDDVDWAIAPPIKQ